MGVQMMVMVGGKAIVVEYVVVRSWKMVMLGTPV
jgi:hypothetical protein